MTSGDEKRAGQRERPRRLGFDTKTYAWQRDIDYRAHPETYRVGRGEQGVLIVEPYKSELVPLWRFKTPDIARISAHALLKKFENYLAHGDFVGADMARKFLQMGYTRARRYANYKGGRKYKADEAHTPLPRGTGTDEKAESANTFYAVLKQAEAHPLYAEMKKRWKQERG